MGLGWTGTAGELRQGIPGVIDCVLPFLISVYG